MSQTTKIEWTEATLNPWTGCTKVDPACAHCYIDGTPPFRIAGRKFERGHIPLVFHMERLDAMRRRRKPTLYFVNSLSDLFHEDASDEQICAVFDAMRAAQQHTFQILTKRHDRMRDFCWRLRFSGSANGGHGRVWLTDEIGKLDGYALMGGLPGCRPLPNVWLGVTIGNRRFVHRADVLRDTPAAVRFISAEPLLGPLVAPWIENADAYSESFDGEYEWGDAYAGTPLDLTGIDWLICGGESGPKHRPFNPQHARDLRDACAASGTAFFMKQMGGWRPGTALEDLPEDLRIREFPR
jgi:protein gp37